MSIGTWFALALLLVVVTGYFFVTQQGNEITARQRNGEPAAQELTLAEAIVILWREGVGAVRKLLLVQQRYKHQPVRKHSAAYLGKSAVKVTTLQTICRRG